MAPLFLIHHHPHPLFLLLLLLAFLLNPLCTPYAAKAPPFNAIPKNVCPDVCYDTPYAQQIATWQCQGRSKCIAQQCGHTAGYACAWKTTPKTTVSISLLSAGSEDGDIANIVVNRVSVYQSALPNVPEKLADGFNIATLQQGTGAYNAFLPLNLFFSSNDERLQAFLHAQPFGTVIFIVVKGDSISRLGLYSRWLLESLGASQVASLQPGDGYCLAGRIGALPKSAKEQLRSKFGGPARVSFSRFDVSRTRPRAGFVDINILSRGNDDGDVAGILVNGLTVLTLRLPGAPTSFGSGMNVIALNRISGAYEAFRSFNFFFSSENARMHAFLETLDYGTYILIAVRGDATSRLTPVSRWILESLGSAVVRELQSNDGWAMVGRVGAAPDSALEALFSRFGGGGVLRETRYRLKRMRRPANTIDIRLFSAGYDDGNQAEIQVNGLSASRTDVRPPPPQIGNGVNVAVCDKDTGKFKAFDVFNFFFSSAKDDFKAYAASLRGGDIVLIAVQGDTGRFFDDEMKRICKRFGSKVVTKLQHRDSWAMLGRVGAKANTAIEELKTRFSGPVKLALRNYPLS